MYRVNQSDISARNQLNAMADILERDLINAMAQFTGKKVWKKSGYGSLTAATAKIVDGIIDAHDLDRDNRGATSGPWTVTFASQVNSVWCTIKLRYDTTQGHCDYVEESFRIGRRDENGILIEPEQELAFPEGRPQFTQRQVEYALKAADNLEAQARNLRSTVSCFQR